MQSVMLVFAKKDEEEVKSLRKAIGEDLVAEEYNGLRVARHKKISRSPGWMTVSSSNEYGSLKIKWEPNYGLLTVRAISKRGHTPYRLMGLFTEYLLTRHAANISNISIPVRQE